MLFYLSIKKIMRFGDVNLARKQYLIIFLDLKGPFGYQKAYIGIQKGPIHCLVISSDRLTPIWLSVVT